MKHKSTDPIASSWPPSQERNALPGSVTSDLLNNPRLKPQAEDLALASVWQMESPADANAALDGAAFVYRRDGHPNAESLAAHLRQLHGAQSAVLTAQGMSALGALALTILKPGDEVWIAEELYGKSVHLFAKALKQWQVHAQTFDPAGDLQQLANSKAAMVLVETLSNPRLRLPALEPLVQVCQELDAKLVVDNTFATHLLCRPLDLGADIVIESLGKIVNGHSDAMVGLIASQDAELMDATKATVSTYGMASSPLDCYLTQRGLSSLAVRMQRACENALELSKHLEQHAAVKHLDYPGLKSHPQHLLATQLLHGGFGWMLAMHIDASQENVHRFLDALRPDIPFVPSLGDACTTFSHPTSTSHRGYSAEQLDTLGISFGTIRISCGLEPSSWLLEKFTSALDLLEEPPHS